MGFVVAAREGKKISPSWAEMDVSRVAKVAPNRAKTKKMARKAAIVHKKWSGECESDTKELA